MKLKTLCCNLTPLKKDITRFFPLWVVYFIGGCLIMLSAVGYVEPGIAAEFLGESLGLLSVVNLVYAALTAGFLFGDLHKSKLCNSLHALPIRREGWFFSHVAAGMLFSIVPNFAGMLLMLPYLGVYWYIGFLWLLGMTLEYLFFFGVAALAMQLSGNRIAYLGIYAVINFGSRLIYWFIDNVYRPVLYGITIPSEPFAWFCPTAMLTRDSELLPMLRDTPTPAQWRFEGLGEGWIYLGILAVLGVVFGAIALLLYRKRHLEVAGDLIAFSAVRPVASVGIALCVGAVFAIMGTIFVTGYVVFLLVGLIVGWFGGQMLLNRTIRVFRLPAIIKGAVLTVLVLASVFAAEADVFGIVRYIPKEEQVQSVTLTISDHWEEEIVLTEQEDIETILSLHETILENRDREDKANVENVWLNIELSYTLKDGRKVNRTYNALLPKAETEGLKKIMSRPSVVMKELAQSEWHITWVELEGEAVYMARWDSLREAILADCEEGNMAQHYALHPGYYTKAMLHFQLRNSAGTGKVVEIYVYDDCRNIIAWIDEYLKSSQSNSFAK